MYDLQSLCLLLSIYEMLFMSCPMSNYILFLNIYCLSFCMKKIYYDHFDDNMLSLMQIFSGKQKRFKTFYNN